MVPRLVAVVGVALLLGRATPARGGEVHINPVRIELSSETRSEVIALRNGGTEPASFEMQVKSWGESKTGEMQLAATGDVVVFPVILLLAPGEERNLRVGATVRPGPVEKTYRLLVQEMPPPAKPDKQQVRVLTRVGVPVFIAPTHVVERAVLKDLAVRDGKARFSVANTGTIHVRTTAVKVALKGAKGAVLGNREAPPWYLLAGGERSYEVELGRESCAAVREVSVAVTLDSKQALQAALPTPEGVCAP